jgi:hypothetical protein
MPYGIAARVYLAAARGNRQLRGIAPSGVRTFLPRLRPGAILRPSEISFTLRHNPAPGKPGANGNARANRVCGATGRSVARTLVSWGCKLVK